MPQVDIIHFAGHYLADERVPTRSRLLRAKVEGSSDDGELSAYEMLLRKQRRPNLIVLSACHTRLDQNETTATLYTEGIALSCLTEDGKCHIAFFRPVEHGHGDGQQHKHNLDLTITRIDPTGEHDLPADELNLNAGSKLVLEVVNPTYPKCDHYTRGDFLRWSPDNDPNDYRWVVDMEGEIHPDDPLELKVAKHPKGFRSTLLEVNYALFYTESLTEFRVEKVSGKRI